MSSDSFSYEQLLCPEKGEVPSIKHLRANEGLYERFVCDNSRIAIYIPSLAARKQKGFITPDFHVNQTQSVFRAYILSEQKGMEISFTDPFVRSNMTQNFVITKENKSNNGRGRCGFSKTSRPLHKKPSFIKRLNNRVGRIRSDPYVIGISGEAADNDLKLSDSFLPSVYAKSNCGESFHSGTKRLRPPSFPDKTTEKFRRVMNSPHGENIIRDKRSISLVNYSSYQPIALGVEMTPVPFMVQNEYRVKIRYDVVSPDKIYMGEKKPGRARLISEPATAYGFAGIAIIGLHFVDGYDPTFSPD